MLCESSAANVTSTSDNATWIATKPRPAVARCAAVREVIRPAGSARPARQAGTPPKKSVVKTADVAVTKKTVWSGSSFIPTPSIGERKNGRSHGVPYHAIAAPSAAPAKRDEERLGKILPRDAHPGGANCRSHGELVPALVQLRQHQPAHVHAAEEQHDGDESLHQVERCRVLRTEHGRKPGLRGFHHHALEPRQVRGFPAGRTPRSSRCSWTSRSARRRGQATHPVSGGRRRVIPTRDCGTFRTSRPARTFKNCSGAYTLGSTPGQTP